MPSNPEYITTLGLTRGRPPHRPFGIKQADRLLHQYIIGQTGTGKSTLLLNMMMQDAAHSQGFCLIDPHGDLAEAVRSKVGCDVVYWDAADPDCPYGYNPITHVGEAHRPLVASGLIETLKKQWSDAWGARMEHLLRYSLLALLETPGSTLQNIIPMFLYATFRKEILVHVTDPQVQQFWEQEFPRMNYKTTADGVASIANKLGAFLAHPVVRNAICTPKQPLRFRQLMDEGKVLIVNLAKGRLGADVSNILGGLIASSLALAAYSRQNRPETQRRSYFLYLDEFHLFTTSAFAGMLSELRKYGLGLVLTTQFNSQLDEGVFDSVMGNVGTLMVFRVGVKDATVMVKQLGGDVPLPRDLVNLTNFEVFVQVMVGGRQSRAFSAYSIPPAWLRNSRSGKYSQFLRAYCAPKNSIKFAK